VSAPAIKQPGPHKPQSKFALPRSSPEAQGVPSKAILEFINAAEKGNFNFHSFMLIRHGHVIAEGWWDPYTPQLRHMMFSASKGFTSAAVGLAIAEGHFGLDDTVISFFPEDLPETISDNLAAMKVKHLLTMSSGQDQDLQSIVEPSVFEPSLLGTTTTAAVDDNWPKQFLSIPVKNPPGSQFFYSSGAVYMLSAIVQKTTGQTMLEYLQPRLFEPMGIEGAVWETDPRGINTGGWGLSLKTEDLARFGLLYLQNGMWNGRRLLPAQWVQAATSPQMRTVTFEVKPEEDRQNWCGYLLWQNRPGGFRMEGAFGQFCVVLPEQDAVIVFTAEYYDTQKGLDLVWKHLLPVMQSTALPPDKTAQKRLAQKIASLSLLPEMGFGFSPLSQNVSGHKFKLEENSLGAESITFHFKDDTCDFVLKDDKGEHRITCGLNKWRKGRTDLPYMVPRFLVTSPRNDTNPPLVASGTWTDANTFTMTWQFFETPHRLTVPCRFKEDKVHVEFISSLSHFFKPSALSKGGDLALNGRLSD